MSAWQEHLVHFVLCIVHPIVTQIQSYKSSTHLYACTHTCMHACTHHHRHCHHHHPADDAHYDDDGEVEVADNNYVTLSLSLFLSLSLLFINFFSVFIYACGCFIYFLFFCLHAINKLFNSYFTCFEYVLIFLLLLYFWFFVHVYYQ